MLFTPKFPLQRGQSDQHNKIKSKFKVSCNTVVQGIQQKQKFNDWQLALIFKIHSAEVILLHEYGQI
jgi:hypothetical protein